MARLGQASCSSSGEHSAGLVGALGLGQRNPVDQGAVVLRRRRRRQLLRRGRLALRGRALTGLDVIGLVAVAKSLRLRLEDTHGTAERPGAVRQLLGPEEHKYHCRQDQQVPGAEFTKHIRPSPRGTGPCASGTASATWYAPRGANSPPPRTRADARRHTGPGRRRPPGGRRPRAQRAPPPARPRRAGGRAGAPIRRPGCAGPPAASRHRCPPPPRTGSTPPPSARTARAPSPPAGPRARAGTGHGPRRAGPPPPAPRPARPARRSRARGRAGTGAPPPRSGTIPRGMS